MHIVCPNCSTSYAIDPGRFGSAGRSVRCARCKEIWQAKPLALARAEATESPAPPPSEDLSGWGIAAEEEVSAVDTTPIVESPPLTTALPDGGADLQSDSIDAEQHAAGMSDKPRGRIGRLFARPPLPNLPAMAARRGIRPSFFHPSWSGACTLLAAITMGLIFWRNDIVRHMPQTADFYRLVGLNVNLRSLSFKDVRVGRETVDGKPVLVIEGVIVAEGRKAVDLPRLRFVVRDEAGAELYAWNLVLDQPSVRPSEPTWFRSRLAAPPPEGRSVDVRFFNSRDAGGRA